MSYADELIEVAGAVRRAHEIPEGAAVALLNSGCLARRDGSVTGAEADRGAKWEGLAGLPVFRLLRSGKRVHLSPGAPVLTVDPQAYRAAERALELDRCTTMRLAARAERYAADEMGWPDAEMIDAKAAGRDGQAVAVLLDPGTHGGAPFVVAFDSNGEMATDAGDPADFGWEEENDG